MVTVVVVVTGVVENPKKPVKNSCPPVGFD
jgi:hypothetical protein